MPMSPGAERSVHTLVGQVHALNLIVQAMLMACPEKEVLAARVRQAEAQGLSSLENLPIPGEELIAGFRGVMDAALNLLSGPPANRP
jgi:hypothetical protein